jgi:peptidase E
MSKQIICLGGGGLDKDCLLEMYILAQSNKINPKICFLPTASGDNPECIKHFFYYFSRLPCDPSYLALFNPHTKDIEDFILSRDIIFVGGGHSKSMLGVWREWGLDKTLSAAYNDGILLSGGSAGSVCWFDECITDSIPGGLTPMNCLGILPYSNCPHFLNKERRQVYSNFVSSGQVSAGYAIDDCAASHFVDGKFLRGVSSEKFANNFFLEWKDGKLKAKKQYTYCLRDKKNQDDLIFNSNTFQNIEEEAEASSDEKVQ